MNDLELDIEFCKIEFELWYVKHYGNLTFWWLLKPWFKKAYFAGRRSAETVEWNRVEGGLPADFQRVHLKRANGKTAEGHFIQCDGYTRIMFDGTSKAAQYWEPEITHWRYLNA